MAARIVVSEFVSLDGVMEAPGGEAGYRHAGWVMKLPDPRPLQYKLDEVLAHEALLTLVSAHPLDSGTVILTYRPQRNATD